MPISQQLYRNHVGNYHSAINKNSINQAAQQNMLHDLAKYPGDAAKRARAILIMQSILIVSNISLVTGEAHIRPQGGLTRQTRSRTDLAKQPYSPMASVYNNGGALLRSNFSLLLPRACRNSRGTKKGKPAGRHFITQWVKQNSKTAPLATSALGSGASAFPVLKRDKSQREKNLAARQTKEISLFLEKQYGKNNENSIATLINKSINYIIYCPDGLADISLKLMKHSGEYGSYAGETLSAEQQYAVVRSWLSAQIFDKSIGEFIGRIIVRTVRENACNNRQPLKLPNEVLFSNLVGKIGIPMRGAAEGIENAFPFNDASRNYLSHEVLNAELPCFVLHPDVIDKHNLYAGTVDWGFLHAGLVIARQIEKDISQFSIDDLIQLGSSVEDMLREGAIDAELVGIFSLPAKLLLIKQQAEQGDDVAIEKIFRSEEGNKMALAAFFSASERQKAEENPYNRFIQALENYHTRTQLRELSAASAAGANNTITALDDKAAGPFCPAEKPAGRESIDADRLFNQQNENIAAKYAVVKSTVLGSNRAMCSPGLIPRSRKPLARRWARSHNSP